ncbi:MAG: Rrf2 family transcriptional regulator [Proteobacteria bacterium]|nr:Rrf2 family transcriptional regulator [Pseudomonadota bacterium]
MRLNVQTDYALRVLMMLTLEPNRLVTIQEISERFKVSKNHLMKVAQALGHLGYIETVRGRAGGLRLAKQAADIRLGEVVWNMEGDFALVECFPPRRNACPISGACRLNGVLSKATTAFLDVLDQYTLEDLVANNADLRAILAPEAA